MANQIAEFFARIFLKNEISPELDNIVDELLHLNKVIENSKHPEMLVQEKQRAEELSLAFVNAGGKAEELSQILTYKGAAGANRFNKEIENLNTSSYNNFRAIGQMDRVTREFASGGLNQGLNGLTMFGNSLTRLAVQEGGFKNALTGLVQSFTGPAGIVLAVSAAIGFFEEWQKTQKKAETATQKHAKEIEKEKQDIDQLYESTAKEASQVASLVAVLSNETETRNRKIKALDELKKINPEIFKGLKLEEGVVIGLNTAYENYITNLSSVIALKIKQKEIEDVTEKILKAQGVTTTQAEKDIKATGKTLKDSLDLKKTDNQLRKESIESTIKENKENVKLNGLLEERKKLFDALRELSPQVKITGEGNTSREKTTPTDKSNLGVLKASQDFYKEDIYIYKDYADAITKEEERLAINKAKKEKASADEILRIHQKATIDLQTNQKVLGQEIAKMIDKDTKEQIKQQKIDDKESLKDQEYFAEQRIKNIEGQLEVELKLHRKNSDLQRQDYQKAMAQLAVLAMTSFNPAIAQKFIEALNNLSYKEAGLESQTSKLAKLISKDLTGALVGMYDAMQHNESPLQALGDYFAKLAEQIAAAAVEAAIFAAIMVGLDPTGATTFLGGGAGGGGFTSMFKNLIGLADGGIVNKPTLAMVGEGSQSEAIMPLSKLGNVMNNSFSAGAMSGTNNTNNGQFVLRGSDLVLALQRSNVSLNLRRGA